MQGRQARQRWRSTAWWSITLVVGVCLSDLSRAQQSPPESPSLPTAPLDRDFIRGDQQRLLEEQQQRLEQLQNLPGERAAPAPPETSEPSTCFDVDRITLQGATRLSDAQQQALTAPYVGRCLHIDDLNALLRDITDHYIAHGHVTTRAYLPRQDFKDGEVEVMVLEGRLEALDSGGEVPTPRELAMASPADVGEVLDLHDLEQLIDQLNRLPSRQSTLALEPGEAPGASRVRIDSDGGQPFRLSLGRHNDGTDLTGRQQWSLGVEWDSPLGLADQFTAELGQDVTRRSERGSRSRRLSYRVPYGNWNLSWAYSDSDYHAVIEADGFDFDIDGTSERHRLQAERLLIRDDVSTTTGSLALSRVTSRHNILGHRVALSSQTLADVTLGLNHGRRLGGGLVNADLQWSHGLRHFGARHDGAAVPELTAEQVADLPSAQFEKTTLTLSYLRPFSLGDQSLRFISLAHGQWSDDELYSPYRLSLGGPYSVRGFQDQSLSGDSGAYWRNEIRWQHPLDMARPVFDRMNVSLAYDVGVIHHGDHNPERHGRLSGTALGIGASGDHLAADVSVARSLDRPEALSDRETPVTFRVELLL